MTIFVFIVDPALFLNNKSVSPETETFVLLACKIAPTLSAVRVALVLKIICEALAPDPIL
jgi:hypothetical protein